MPQQASAVRDAPFTPPPLLDRNVPQLVLVEPDLVAGGPDAFARYALELLGSDLMVLAEKTPSVAQ